MTGYAYVCTLSLTLSHSHLCLDAHAHTHVFTATCTDTHALVLTRTCTHTLTHVLTHTCTHTLTHVFTATCTHTLTHSCLPEMMARRYSEVTGHLMMARPAKNLSWVFSKYLLKYFWQCPVSTIEYCTCDVASKRGLCLKHYYGVTDSNNILVLLQQSYPTPLVAWKFQHLDCSITAYVGQNNNFFQFIPPSKPWYFTGCSLLSIFVILMVF